ncbi:hypothetical protein LIT25_21335 [Bacillus sp. F19]|nr:hypothetical protein LIT25_21335 [Bacillus sp. F19]
MEKKVFLTSEVNGLPSQSLQSMDPSSAYQIERSGNGIVVEFNKLDELENGINNAVARYRKKYDEMIKSPRPEYKVEGAIDFYAAEMKSELEKEVTELNRQYSGIVEAMKEEAMRDAANKRRFISDDERKAARDVVSETVTAIKLGDGRVTLDSLIAQVPYMTDTRKLALLQEISRVTEATHGHKFADELTRKAKDLYGRLEEVKSGDMLAVKIAQSLPGSADGAFRRLQMTHKTFKDHKHNQHNPNKR